MSEEPAEERRPSRKRLVILGAAAIAVISVAVVLIVVFGKKHVPAHPLVERKDGGPAIHAPIGPRVPGTGVELSGLVVDGAGLPVAGATIEAELEKGMQDRALATADAGVAQL